MRISAEVPASARATAPLTAAPRGPVGTAGTAVTRGVAIPAGGPRLGGGAPPPPRLEIGIAQELPAPARRARHPQPPPPPPPPKPPPPPLKPPPFPPDE